MRTRRVDVQCPNCRGFIQDSDRICNHCGAQVPIQQASPLPTPQVAPKSGGNRFSAKWVAITVVCILIGGLVIAWMAMDQGNQEDLCFDEPIWTIRNELDDYYLDVSVAIENNGSPVVDLLGCWLYVEVYLNDIWVDMVFGPIDGTLTAHGVKWYDFEFYLSVIVYDGDELSIELRLVDEDGTILDIDSFDYTV